MCLIPNLCEPFTLDVNHTTINSFFYIINSIPLSSRICQPLPQTLGALHHYCHKHLDSLKTFSLSPLHN
ncbi:ORF938 [White spot syndrome virus]|uniref:ORF938 n=1 Tax=White spot syndrome virus TaxID=342409 RepID=A0A2D3I6L9_9VIRU|nr:ORF938 [White spot syndrome virus]